MTSAKDRRANKAMRELVQGSEEYYRNHPEVGKISEIEEQRQKSQQERDKWELEHYGTVTKDRDSR